MLDYQKLALDKVRENAKINNKEQKIYLEQVCKSFNISIVELVDQVLQSHVTINFHIDRYSSNGKTVIENMIEQGQYHGQFQTGTTNGGKTAFIGGDRFLWEQRLFHNVYPANSVDRPKYGALNIFKYIDGASVRFGSCFFSLKKEIVDRCTLSYGDSSINPTTLCTSDTFEGVLADIFKDVKDHTVLLNQVVSSQQEALAILMNKSNKMKNIGRNLDCCIETHIHGNIDFKDDVDSLFIDTSYKNTIFEGLAEELCRKYKIELQWIPERQITTTEMGEFFRGPIIPILAKKIDYLFGNSQGVINANLIGQASHDSFMHGDNWRDIGNEAEIFQYLKQLWHTVGYFG